LTDSLIDSLHINFDEQSLWVLNLALSLVMFGIALDISVRDFKALLQNPKPILVGVLSQFILLPAVTFVFVYFLNPYPSFALGMFLVAACPGGNISNFISHLAGGNTALSISLTAIATVLAIIMTPLNLQFWGALYAPTEVILKTIAISPFQMILLVALLLGLPLVLGMWLKQLNPKLAKKLSKILRVFSLLFFVVLIFIALYKNSDVFLDYVALVFFLVLGHNVLAFFTGFSMAKLLKLSKAETKSITIETGIQNSGLGLLLIFTFFDGLGGMALIAAFWGLWHLVSGLVLASIWGQHKFNKNS